MRRKKFYTKKFYHQKSGNRLLKKITASLLALTLVIPPFSYTIDSNLNLVERRAEAATSLADINLLKDVDVKATLDETKADHYEVALSLSGTGLANAELVGPDKVVVFYAPDLAGKMSVGKASVRVEILPITMDDLPALSSAVDGLTGSLTKLVSGLVSGIDNAVNGTLLAGIISINGLDKINIALDKLNNIDDALTDLLAYEEQVPAVVQDNGLIIVDFSEGLGQHLETTVKNVVIDLVNEVLNAVNGLEIKLLSGVPILGDILNGLLTDLVMKPIVKPLLSAVTISAKGILNGLANGVIDLTDDLADIQLIGHTTVSVNTSFQKPSEVQGTIKIYGAAINNSLINVSVLSKEADFDTITINEMKNYGLEFKKPPYTINVKETLHRDLYKELNVLPVPGEDPKNLPKLEDLQFTWVIKDGTQVAGVDQSGKVIAKGVGTTSIVVTAKDKNGQLRKATAEVFVNLKNIKFAKSIYVYPTDGKNMFDKLIVEPAGFNITPGVFDWSVYGEDKSEHDLALQVNDDGIVQQNGDKGGFVILKAKLKKVYNEIDGNLDDPYDQAMTLIKINKVDNPIGDPTKEW
ncbi:adhesive domain-containing protein [Schinkia sp. CFF1]